MTNTFLTLLPLLVIHMRLFVWKLLMDMFFCWKEFPGMVGFLFCQIINFSGLMMSDALRHHFTDATHGRLFIFSMEFWIHLWGGLYLFFFFKKKSFSLNYNAYMRWI